MNQDPDPNAQNMALFADDATTVVTDADFVTVDGTSQLGGKKKIAASTVKEHSSRVSVVGSDLFSRDGLTTSGMSLLQSELNYLDDEELLYDLPECACRYCGIHDPDEVACCIVSHSHSTFFILATVRLDLQQVVLQRKRKDAGKPSDQPHGEP
jgi:hypothetical protein